MAESEQYSDIDRRFSSNDRGDIRIVTDAEALEQALLNIIETAVSDSERVMRPEFGSNLRDAVFQPMDQITNEQIRKGLQEVFEQDQRFELVSFQANQLQEQNKLKLIISWSSPLLIEEQITVASI